MDFAFLLHKMRWLNEVIFVVSCSFKYVCDYSSKNPIALTVVIALNMGNQRNCLGKEA